MDNIAIKTNFFRNQIRFPYCRFLENVDKRIKMLKIYGNSS